MKITQIDGAKTDPTEITKSIEQLLATNHACSIATVTPDGAPYINTAFYVYDKTWHLYIMTNPATVHAQNVAQDERCSMTIYDSHQVPAGKIGLMGLQMFGHMKQVKGVKAGKVFGLYAKHFSWTMTWAGTYRNMERITKSRFFEFIPDRVKVFDEPRFGEDVYLTVKIAY
jgi:uncharacterized protein YhbP (UPF0306 family)